jgi:glycosyltransferase involved in cell wall biosynthesis
VTQSYYPSPGGVSRSIEVFSQELRKLKHNVYIIAPYVGGNKQDPHILYIKSLLVNTSLKNNPNLFFITENKAVRYVSLIQKYLIPELNELTDAIPVTSFGDVLDWSRSKNIDIVHSHIAFNMGEYALKLSEHLAVPLVYTVHTKYDFLKYRFKAEALPVDFDMAAVFFGSRCNGVIFPTFAMYDFFGKKGLLHDNSIIIPTGIDISKFSYSPYKTIFTEDTFVIGTLCRLDTEKNLELLFEVVNKALDAHADIGFLAVGDGNMKNNAINFFNKHNKLNRVYFYGEARPDSVSSLYNEMDCFLYTSLFETQGLVLTEAQASGLPVIALDCPVSSEVLSDTGYLAKSKDDLLYSLLQVYIMDKKELYIKARIAIDNARKFSIESSTKKLLDFYNSL